MMLATWFGGVPNIIFEPNAEPGLTNKLLARLSKRIATGYEISAQAWGGKAVVTGCPVRAEFFSIPAHKPSNPLRLLITGGSQGALPINRAFVDSMDRLARRKNQLSIVHQTGERDYDAVRTAYARREILAEVVPFLTNMPERFAWADIIVCRAGAITLQVETPDTMVDQAKLEAVPYVPPSVWEAVKIARGRTPVKVTVGLFTSRPGARMLIAGRDNEANLQSFGVVSLRAKLTAFAVSGALAVCHWIQEAVHRAAERCRAPP